MAHKSYWVGDVPIGGPAKRQRQTSSQTRDCLESFFCSTWTVRDRSTVRGPAHSPLGQVRTRTPPVDLRSGWLSVRRMLTEDQPRDLELVAIRRRL
eukprot:267473-Prymnesium_polylepis.1